MDPTEGELQAITNLAEARAWCGVEGAALGQPARVREIALIPRPTWDRVVAGLQIQDGGDPRPPLRVLTPVEEARLESFRRVCCLRSGRPIDLPGDPAAAAPAVAPAPFPAAGGAPAPAPGGPQARKLKLSRRWTQRFSRWVMLKSQACTSVTATAMETSPVWMPT